MADWIYESHGNLPMAFLFGTRIIPPHPDPLPRGEREIREEGFIGNERSNDINERRREKRWKSERSC
jgi:hypothetical protein